MEKKVLHTKKWFFYELFTERFFEEPKMVLLWHGAKPLFWIIFLGLSSVLDTSDFYFADKQNKGNCFNRFSISYCYNNNKKGHINLEY